MKQAIVLAAGEGQRLRPFTVSRPKAMLTIADKPVLEFVVEALAQNGIRDIIIVVGYCKEHVYDYLGAGEALGVNITYVAQERQLGTAHALAQVRDQADESFLVLPGDNLIDAATIKPFLEVEPEAVLVKRVPDPVRYGVVTVSKGEVTSIQEKPDIAGSNLVNTGVYAFSKGIFDSIDDVLDIPDVLNGLIAAGTPVRAVETEETWLDIVYPWDIISLNSTILDGVSNKLGGNIETGVNIQGEVVIGEGTVIRSGTSIYGPAVIGSGCDIGPQVCIKPATSLGDNVVIAPFSHVENSVIGNDVSLGPGCIVSDSVIGKGCVIKGRFTAVGGQSQVVVAGSLPAIQVGVMMGEDCAVENNVSVQPGAIIGNRSQIQMSRVVSGILPDNSLVF